MNRTTLTSIALWGLLFAGGTRAQAPEPASTAPMPAVNTSAAPAPEPASTAPMPAVNTSAEAAPAQPAEQAPKPSAEPAQKAPDSKPSSAQAGAADGSKATPGGARGPKANDRLELGTTEISGNRELPKVLYVVPWRRAEIGDAVGRPPNSLVEEALTPVDRDVFRRQNRYYATLQGGAAPPKSQPAAASQAAPHAAPKDER